MLPISISQLMREKFRRALAPAAALALILLAAPLARAQKISIEFDQAADFTKFKTFSVRDGQMNARTPQLNNELTKKNIQAEIEKALTAKGLTVGTGRTDLNVFYTFGAARKVETETYPAGWRGLRTRVARVPYNEGTLVIDLRDPTTRSLVWRGIASDSESNPAKMADKLDDMVRKAIAKYPPKK
jgi:Domain of unknown function (DUF4136)